MVLQEEAYAQLRPLNCADHVQSLPVYPLDWASMHKQRQAESAHLYS